MGNWVTKVAFCLMLVGLALAISAALYPSAQWDLRETILLIGGGLAFFIGIGFLLFGMAATADRRTEGPLSSVSLLSWHAAEKRHAVPSKGDMHGNRRHGA